MMMRSFKTTIYLADTDKVRSCPIAVERLRRHIVALLLLLFLQRHGYDSVLVLCVS
jgi:hypothetical protein